MFLCSSYDFCRITLSELEGEMVETRYNDEFDPKYKRPVSVYVRDSLVTGRTYIPPVMHSLRGKSRHEVRGRN